MRLLKTTAALLLLLAAWQSAMADDKLALDALVAEAESSNPALRAMKYRYEAARERVPQAGALADPRLMVGFMGVEVDNFAFDRIPMTTKFVGLSQELPSFGKRALRREAASHEFAARQQEYEDRRLRLRAEVRKAYYELYTLRKSREIVDKNVTLMYAFIETAEARYSVGKGEFRDVVKAQVELAMLVDRKIAIEREEREARAMLGGLLGRDAPVMGEVGELSPTPVGLGRDELVARARDGAPSVKAAASRVEKGESMVALAGKEYFPDFMFEVQYHQTERLQNGMYQSDRLSAMVSVNLPIWWGVKQAPMVREAVHEKAMAEEMLADARVEVTAKVDALASDIAQYDRTLKLYADVAIPQATEDLSSALAGYEVGRADLLALLDSRRTLYEYELGYYEALSMREKKLAELAAVVGRDFQER